MSEKESNRYTYEDYEAMAHCLLSQQPHKPTIGIICGSGLMNLANKLEERYTIPYEKIPNFPVSTVEGHIGQFSFGTLNGKTVVMMQGRFHLYEGYPAWKLIAPVRVMKLLGVHTVVITNAAGGMNPNFKVGDIMLMIDHIGLPTLSGMNPLAGDNDERFGPRFTNMSNVYDKELRALTMKVAQDLQCSTFIKEGVYVMVSGPSYESPAELRFLRTIGADVVGMSTVPEAIAARHCGMRVLGFSLVTNSCIMDYKSHGETNHEEVLETGKWRAGVMQDLIAHVVERMNGEE
ncbi:purine nucleoside phosphorylase-like isoform X1 [Diadema setosum]|uniref:purine nucleoside phosphorylase-like isoform X1 n=2 Tax=Diadema setosum TaxID=31175 RepID=UPI003B3AEF79